MATSVLPKPTSPQTSRSMGRRRSMSRFTCSMADSWSTVGSCRKLSSMARCMAPSGVWAWPGMASRAAYSSSRSAAMARMALRAFLVTFTHAPEPRRASGGEASVSVVWRSTWSMFSTGT